MTLCALQEANSSTEVVDDGLGVPDHVFDNSALLVDRSSETSVTPEDELEQIPVDPGLASVSGSESEPSELLLLSVSICLSIRLFWVGNTFHLLASH